MKSALAPVIVSSILFAALFGRRATAEHAPRPPPRLPAPSTLPPLPWGGSSVPDPPWALPPIPPQMVHVKAGHRYKVVADVQAAQGVGMQRAARGILDALKLDDPSIGGIKNLDRPGVGEVTRVTLRVTPTVDGSFPIETKMRTPGIGTCWLVSIQEVTE